MTQHDMNIDNQDFPTFRSDLNNALKALASMSSGATEPSTRFPNQLWADTANNLLKIRNTANTAWISLMPLNGSHSANTIRGRLTSNGVLQDLTITQVKSLLSLETSDILTDLKTVDGSGSGLDSDLLDGQEGSYYRSATNINAGTLALARLAIATQAEAEAGTSSSKLMTPQRVAQAIAELAGDASSPTYESSELTFGNYFTTNHSLGRVPKNYQIVARCKTANNGYSIGDEIQLTGMVDGDGSRGYVSWANSTYVRFRNQNSSLQNTSGNYIVPTASHWKYVVYAW